MFCWVVGLLVLPTVGALRWMLALVRVPLLMYWVLYAGCRCRRGLWVFPLVRVLWVAFGLGGVRAASGVGVAVIGSGCGLGRGWSLGVAGGGPSPLLAEGLVGGAAGWSTLLS